MDVILYWNHHPIGWMKDIRADNLHIYGKWQPDQTSLTANFLAVLVANFDQDGFLRGQVLVGFGKNQPTHQVSDFRDGEIDILPVSHTSSADWP